MRVSSKNSSTEGQKNPYERLSFWKDPKNKFWLNTYKNRPEIIDRYEDNLLKWEASEKNYIIIDPTLK